MTCCNWMRSPHTAGSRGFEIFLDRHGRKGGVVADDVQDFLDDIVEAQRLVPGFLLFQEGPDFPDHLRSPVVVPDDVPEDLGDLLHVGIVLREETLRRLGVAEDGGQGLIDLMGQGAREFSQRGYPGDVGKILPELPGLRLNLLPAR